ncbi:MAG TPA: hypothetical protein VF608_10745 [Thermoanaerobaculia bacterium]
MAHEQQRDRLLVLLRVLERLARVGKRGRREDVEQRRAVREQLVATADELIFLRLDQ